MLATKIISFVTIVLLSFTGVSSSFRLKGSIPTRWRPDVTTKMVGAASPLTTSSTTSPGMETSSTRTPKNIESLKYNYLQSSSFAHPQDLLRTNQIGVLPAVENLVRRALTYVESTLFVELLSSSVQVSAEQMPSLYKKLQFASEALNMEAPNLFVVQNPVPNAYTLGVLGKKPFVVLHSSLIDLLTEDEVTAVIAHELGHLKCEHAVLITAASVLSQFLETQLPAPLLSALNSQLMEWRRYAELSCDRAALLVTQDSSVVVSVMLKLSGGSSSLKNAFGKAYDSEISTDAFLKQADRYEAELKELPSAVRAGSGLLGGSMRTHPLPVTRAKELVKWEKTAQYAGLVSRAEVTTCSESS